MRHTRRRARSAVLLLGLGIIGGGRQLAAQSLGDGQLFTVPATSFLQSVRSGSLFGPTSGAGYSFVLFAVSGLTLTGPALFEQVLTGPVEADQTVNVNTLLTPGGTYAFLLRASGAGLITSFSPDFMDGQAVTCFGTSCGGDSGVDIRNFSLTFAEPPASAVPEPMSMALLGTGLAGVAVARLRRRKHESGAE
jgi:hypothetical protein